MARNLFDGLYRLDQHAQIQPDIAISLPEASVDQKTFTFHLRPRARFSNGDSVVAQDFIYSWSRAVYESGLDISGLYAIEGVDAVASATGLTMLSGLSAPDPYTLVAKLSTPFGSWPATLANPETFVVDPKVVEANRKDWATTPESLVGTGPFKWSDRKAGQSADFVPVTDWWDGSTGYLRKIHLQVVNRVQDAEPEYSHGDFGLVALGTALYDPPVYAKWKPHANDWHIFPAGYTYSLVFNDNSAGPLQGSTGRAGRVALSQAINRTELSKKVCGDVRLCTPATGGPVAKGFVGYLGDGADSNANFDAASAKRTYQSWDPDGSKARGLEYTFYGSSGSYPDGVELKNALTLQQMWRDNLDIDVHLNQLTDRNGWFTLISHGEVQLSRIVWRADYISPEDWFEIGDVPDLFGNAEYDRLVANADLRPFADSGSAYDAVGRLVIRDVLYAPLFYLNFVTVVEPWVHGADGYVWVDAPWTRISILAH